MTTQQIQIFLNSKVPVCGVGTCLRNYSQDTFTYPADAECSTYAGAPDESAAAIIAKVAVACNINPQVILVLLQKEQGLVTSTSPTAAAYQAATGYGCPDTAACDSNYYGFFNQVYHAAWQFEHYALSSSFNYYPIGRASNILYNPRPSCGSESVTIQDQATADLYYYTPYVPNAAALANLNGPGNSCSSYGNRNFWVYYSTWFGSPTQSTPLNGSFDTAQGISGGIEITGWSVDPYSTTSSYIWVNVNGTGGPFLANGYMNWIESLYPNSGPNHAFDETISEPSGTYQICVYGTNSVKLGCKAVTVPNGPNTAGTIDSATGSLGGVTVTGWSLDKRTSVPSYVWVSIDGNGGPVLANLSSTEAAAAYPSLGGLHGFSTTLAASPGLHSVCVSGTDSVTFGCKSVNVPDPAAGVIDSAVGVLGGIETSGWALDQRTSDSTYVWVAIDGSGGPVLANLSSSEALTAYPALGSLHGYANFTAANTGLHTVCVYGTDSVSLGCKSVTVPSPGAGTVDSVTGVLGGIRVTGWSLDQNTSESTYAWINIDGRGGPLFANLSSSEATAAYPNLGPMHGFSAFLPASAGTHELCAYGTDSYSLGCKTVTVPTSVAGSFDTATGVLGGVQISGWSLDQTTSASTYVWVNVDGVGGPIYANQPLNWIDAMFPGEGPNHGYAATVTASPGTHVVCVYGTNSLSLGCKTVTVPYPH